MADRPPDPRARVLDAAEAAFAESGFDGASVRDITDRAGVRLATVSEGFGGKEALFEQVLRRRGDVLDAERLARLASLSARGSGSRRLRALVLAYTEPALARACASAGWRRWFRCATHLAHAREPLRRRFAGEDDAVAAALVDHLADLYPDAAVADLVEAHRFVVVAVLEVFADHDRLDRSGAAGAVAADLENRHRLLVELLRGGLDRVCRRSRSQP